MHRTDFDYALPNELVARYPLEKRTASRLLVLDRNTGAISHHHFADILQFLSKGDCLVFNNSRVIPARLFAHKESGGKVEILVERILSDDLCLAHVRSNKPLKLGAELRVGQDAILVVEGRQEDLFRLRLKKLEKSPVFNRPSSVFRLLSVAGHMPLPPYLHRADELSDQTRYQTVYAEPEGSVAAPTAGLHFDEALLQQLKEKGVECTFVTLHVGAGTFQPVKVDNILEHKMHSEWIEVSKETCEKVQKAKAGGKRVIAVGTTSVRCLETAAKDGVLKPYSGETNIFIYPGYTFKVIDAMITNFHWPQSTLLMLVSAFAGREQVLKAYQEAIKNRYRFFSYGDSMMIATSALAWICLK